MEEKDESLNELLSYKGVFREALATPGLLKIVGQRSIAPVFHKTINFALIKLTIMNRYKVVFVCGHKISNFINCTQDDS